MSLSDKLSPADREAYAEAYAPLAKLRDAYVACGDQVNAKRIRRQISALSSYYQKRARPNIKIWYDESSTFTPDMWDKIKHMNFGDAGGFVSDIKELSRDHGKSWALQQVAAYREVFKKFFTPPTKEQTMIKVFNSSDNPNYHTDNCAGVSLTHLLTKNQMFEIAKIAYKEHGGELLDFIGLKKTLYDARRAQIHVKRALDMYPMQTTELLEQRGYRHIQPYSLEVAMRQVAEAQRVFPHRFMNCGGEPAFYNQVEGEEFRSVCHSSKERALDDAEKFATRTGRDVRTYQLVATTKVEEVPVMTKRVVRRP
jgi:hypothetical protein